MPTEWLTTAPHERGLGQRQRGWRLHAVECAPDETLAQVASRVARCGLLPAHGWSTDLFIERRCTRCERATNRLAAARSRSFTCYAVLG
jgi:hypothetical protein